MDSTQNSTENMINQQAPKGAIWPAELGQTQALRKELYDYYWPKLKMLWKPKTHFHWSKTVQFMTYFMKDLEFPIPMELITAAIQLGNSNRGWSNEEQATVEQIHLASIWVPKTVHPTLQDHATLCVGLEEMKQQLEGIDWIPKGYDFSNLNEQLRMWDHVTAKMDREHIEWCHRHQDFKRPEIKYGYWDRREESEEMRAGKLEEMNIHLEDIPVQQVDKENAHPECNICFQPLIDEEEIHNMFAFAEIIDSKFCPQGSWPRRETWSTNLEEAMIKFQDSREDWQNEEENKLIWEIIQPVYDLQNAYYRLKHSRSLLPESFCVGAVRLKCGHQSFGRQCVTTWVVDRHVDEVTKRLTPHRTTCPLCRQPMGNVVVLEEEEEEMGNDVIVIDTENDLMLEVAVIDNENESSEFEGTESEGSEFEGSSYEEETESESDSNEEDTAIIVAPLARRTPQPHQTVQWSGPNGRTFRLSYTDPMQRNNTAQRNVTGDPTSVLPPSPPPSRNHTRRARRAASRRQRQRGRARSRIPLTELQHNSRQLRLGRARAQGRSRHRMSGDEN